MTNREKYNFDYFTLENYEKLIALAIEQGFEFISYDDEFVENRKDILWRHDLEFSPDIALKMAKIEHKYGVKSTFFVQVHSQYYNIFERYYSDIISEIIALGHHIGLHFDSHYYGIDNEDKLDYYLDLDKNYFEKIFDLKITTFSFHNTTPFTLSCEKSIYGGLRNVYSKFYKTKFNYCADSTGFWRYEILDEVLNDENVRHLQVLTHDAMWSEEVLSPRKRVMKCIQDNADRIKERYDIGLPKLGAKNIDD